MTDEEEKIVLSMDAWRRMNKACGDTCTHDDKKMDNETHMETTMKKRIMHLHGGRV